MSFWRTFGFHTVSAIDTILEKDNFTLEELLDEDELLQELKSQNKKLVDFLIEPATLEKVVGYVSKPMCEWPENPAPKPDSDNPEKTNSENENAEKTEADEVKKTGVKKAKYSYLCSEILCSEVWTMCDALCENKQLLAQLCSILRREPPLDTIFASYVSRVLVYLLQKKPAEMVEYFKKQEEVIPNFLKHLGCLPITELLLRLAACEELEDVFTMQWLDENRLVESLVERLGPQYSDQIHENAALVLVDLINLCLTSQNIASSGSPLLNKVAQEETVSRLLNLALDPEASESALMNGLNIVIELVRDNPPPPPPTTSASGGGEMPRAPQVVPPPALPVEKRHLVIAVLVKYIDQLKNILITPPESVEVMQCTFGQLNPPFGFRRMKVLELFSTVVSGNLDAIGSRIAETDLFSAVLNLLVEYPWNNLLHLKATQMITAVLKGSDENLRLALFKHSNLHDILANAGIAGGKGANPSVNQRKGYMGFLTQIATAIEQAASNNEEIKTIIDGSQEWKNYVEVELVPTRNLQDNPLCGLRPSNMVGEEESDDEDRMAHTSMPVAIAAPVLVTNFPADFPEDYGAPDSDEDESEFNVFDDDGNIAVTGFNTDEENFGFEYSDDDGKIAAYKCVNLPSQNGLEETSVV